jgi:hypothetical protein
MSLYSNRPIPESFFAPLDGLAESVPSRRQCPHLSDTHWLQTGVCRVLSDARSGRGFLQQFAGWLKVCPSQSLHFESLKSQRRLEMLQAVSKVLAQLLQPDASDLAALKDFDLYAGDGHWHSAATHDPVVDGQKTAVGHIYALNLRTHALRHLHLAQGKENDIGAIQKLGAKTLRLDARTGRKVIWVWDRACIHFQLWQKWKMQNGIYFISRTKENMKLQVIGQNPIDTQDPVNQGIQADELVATSQHMYVRRIRHQAPNGETYEFITTEETLEPGVIAWLYLRRWELEKMYDQLKNKLHESKAWASSDQAKTIQAELICLTHNLLTLYERKLEKEHGIKNEAGEKRAKSRREELKKKPKVSRLQTEVIRPLQRSVKLLRWLRANWLTQAPLNETLNRLRTLYATY